MIKMVIKYQTSDGKLFDDEAAARDYENVTFEVKYFYDEYAENGGLRLIQCDIYDYLQDCDYAALAVLDECYAIFVPSMEALNSLCRLYPTTMPDYDNTNFVPHPGYYLWVEKNWYFTPVEALNRLTNEELNALDLNRRDINYLMNLEREAGLEMI